jgi:hypothetical protein
VPRIIKGHPGVLRAAGTDSLQTARERGSKTRKQARDQSSRS